MEEATWEPESTMRVQYPQLFSSSNFEDEIYFKGGENCNTPKYTLVVFDMFRVFCKYKLNFRKLNTKIKKLRNPEIGQVIKAKV